MGNVGSVEVTCSSFRWRRSEVRSHLIRGDVFGFLFFLRRVEVPDTGPAGSGKFDEMILYIGLPGLTPG